MRGPLNKGGGDGGKAGDRENNKGKTAVVVRNKCLKKPVK